MITYVCPIIKGALAEPMQGAILEAREVDIEDVPLKVILENQDLCMAAKAIINARVSKYLNVY